MKAQDYLNFHGVKFASLSDRIKVIKAMEDYKNQISVLFPVDSIFDDFLREWNKTRREHGLKSPIRILGSKAENQIKELYRRGYKLSDIILGFKRALSSDNHRKSNFKYLTPEFITRVDKFNIYCHEESKPNNDQGDYEYQPE